MRRTAPRIAAGLTGAALLVLLAAAPTAAAAASQDSWVTDGHDLAQSYGNPGETAITPATVGKLRRQYTITPKSESSCSSVQAPIVADGKIFSPDATGNSGGVAAYRAGNGKRIWRQTFDDLSAPPEHANVAYADGVLVVSGDGCDSQSDPNGFVTAYDADTGKALWQHIGNSQAYLTLTVTGGLAIVSGTSVSGLTGTYAYGLKDGAAKWQRTDLSAESGAVASGLLVLNNPFNHHTVAVAAATGATRWTSTRTIGVVAGLSGSRFLGRLGHTYGQQRLASVSVANGSVGWTATDGLVAVDRTTAYVGQQDGRLVARRLSDGTVRWTRAFGASEFTANPVVAGGLVYVYRPTGGTSAPVLALRADTGATVDTVATLANAYDEHAVVVGRQLYLASRLAIQAYQLP